MATITRSYFASSTASGHRKRAGQTGWVVDCLEFNSFIASDLAFLGTSIVYLGSSCFMRIVEMGFALVSVAATCC